MASYVTHQYNADEVFKKLEPRIQIDQDDLRRSAIGPDSLIMSDGKTFKNMHKEHVKEYFEALLKSYKEKKLYNDSEAMAFLYGQLNHYMLDVSIHPLIYYLTEK